MKLLKTIGVMAFGVALAALVSSASGRERLFRDIGTIRVDSNMCTAELESQLNNRGFAVTNRERAADAVLEVNMHRVPDHVGNSYRYTAILRDADDGHVLVSESDQETTLIRSKVCSGISDNVVDKIGDRIG